MPGGFSVALTDEARRVLCELQKSDPKRARKAAKALRILQEVGPGHPGFRTHKNDSISGPFGETWQVYLENHTPSAWRMFFCYGPGKGVITVFLLAPHA